MANSTKKVFLITALCAALLAAGFGVNRTYINLAAPKEYMITSDNYFEYQSRVECSGYASAYVIRSMGGDAEGLELYDQFEKKNPDGTVGPLFLEENLEKLGYKCTKHIGTLADLKYYVSKGTPVITLIRQNTFQQYLHYIAVVGYDDEYIYAADSLYKTANCFDEEHYNRKIEEDYFMELWNTDEYLFYIFLTIE